MIGNTTHRELLVPIVLMNHCTLSITIGKATNEYMVIVDNIDIVLPWTFLERCISTNNDTCKQVVFGCLNSSIPGRIAQKNTAAKEAKEGGK